MLDASRLDPLVLIAFGLAILAILLGFVALLTQRIYLSANTQKPVDIEIPLLGKMKTNYPALIFVFLGFFLAFYAFEKGLPAKEKKEIEWTIDGAFKDAEINDWRTGGTLTLFAPNIRNRIDPRVYPNGNFRIRIWIEEGTSFEEIVERIDYIHRAGEVKIHPNKEYPKRENSLLENESSHARTYKPMPLKRFSSGN